MEHSNIIKELLTAGDTHTDLTVLLGAMPGGFFVYRADGDQELIYANDACIRIFGCDTLEQFKELTGFTFPGMVHPDDIQKVQQSISRQIAADVNKMDYVEYRIITQDGTIRWIQDYGHYVRTDAVGGIFYVFLWDATEKREQMLSEKNKLIEESQDKEHKLQTLIQKFDKERSLINQEYLRQLEVIEGLSVSFESICYVDLDRDQVVPYRLSPRNLILFDEEHRSRSYSDYAAAYVDRWVHFEDRETVTRLTSPEYIREKLSQSKTYYFNFRVIAEEGPQYFQLRVVNVGQGNGVCQAVLGYRRVEEELRLQMEQQALLSEALAKANSAISSKNTFLSNMSHDMRTPLHAIFGFTSLARLNLDDPKEAGEYLDRVDTAGRQLLDMIDKVLEMSALSTTTGMDERICDLAVVAGEVCNALRTQAREKGVTLTLDCDALRQSAVFTDHDKVRRMLLCLTDNAVTYTPSGGSVTVRAEQARELPNGYAVYRLTVADTGIGINPDFIDKIFEPFSREKNSTLSGVHGIGMGLTIVKSIVDLMDGKIEVDSAVGRGSTFTVTLTLRTQDTPASPAAPSWPVQVEPEPEPPAPPEPEEDEAETAPEEEKERPIHILLAEDNELNREIEMELLMRQGFTVDPVENGWLALGRMEKAAPGDYDLIIMDLQMPVMDGWQAAAAIRALPNPGLADIPIIALSANALSGDQLRSRAFGIDVHLPKPMDLPLLLRTIAELTGRAVAEKE